MEIDGPGSAEPGAVDPIIGAGGKNQEALVYKWKYAAPNRDSTTPSNFAVSLST